MAHIYAPHLTLANAAQGKPIWSKSDDPVWWDSSITPPPTGTQLLIWNGCIDLGYFDGHLYLRQEDNSPIQGVSHYTFPPDSPEPTR